jgi:prolyl 4-hydroxylase
MVLSVPGAEVLCTSPISILKIENMVSKEECVHLIEAAKRQPLRAARVTAEFTDNDASDGRIAEGRSARVTCLEGDEVLAGVVRRTADMLGVNDPRHFERVQIVHYSEGGQYLWHFDAFDMEAECKQQGQRLVTVLLYLNDVGAGGETGFKNVVEGGGHLSVDPTRGSALVFENVLASKKGVPHRHSLHSGEC